MTAVTQHQPRTDRDAFGDRLAKACRDLGLAIGADAQLRLLSYLEQLERWNATYNLTAIREPSQQLVLHLFDCLAVVKPLAEWLPRGGQLVDVGSGGGLPGVVIAVCRPDVSVHCIDSVGKKAAFIRQLKGVLKLDNLHPHHHRLTDAADHATAFSADVVISRAFASLLDFTALSRSLLAPSGVWIAMKAQRPDDELAELAAHAAAVVFDSFIPLQVPELDAERCLIVLRPF
ncbi:16S rRNA (guanine(527)-N(7))-methyltransferase RsmG [soil metagenome]